MCRNSSNNSLLPLLPPIESTFSFYIFCWWYFAKIRIMWKCGHLLPYKTKMLQFIVRKKWVEVATTITRNSSNLCFYLQSTYYFDELQLLHSELPCTKLYVRFRLSCRCLVLVIVQVVSYIMSYLFCLNAPISYNKWMLQYSNFTKHCPTINASL